VQKNISKAHSPFIKLKYSDILAARDIFTDNLGNINIRAATEGINKELNKSIITLLKQRSKKKKAERNRSFKKLRQQSKAVEFERMMMTINSPTHKNSRNDTKDSFKLPAIKSSFGFSSQIQGCALAQNTISPRDSCQLNQRYENSPKTNRFIENMDFSSIMKCSSKLTTNSPKVVHNTKEVYFEGEN